jgi:hypothetical protein
LCINSCWSFSKIYFWLSVSFKSSNKTSGKGISLTPACVFGDSLIHGTFPIHSTVLFILIMRFSMSMSS